MTTHWEKPGILQFEPAYFERLWGGDSFRTRLDMNTPDDHPLGEAWLLADHPQHQSVVVGGPLHGTTLHQLMNDAPGWLLGLRPKPAYGGRFPLMLKLLDCRSVLSVQVHPDDELAVTLGEPDGGKTEMWYFLDCDPDAEIICGLLPGTTKGEFEAAARSGDVAKLLHHWPVRSGDVALVKARTVHALGAGVLVAEIQQTSDVTYRLFDWNRVGADGKPRELHLDRALECFNSSERFQGPLHVDAGDEPTSLPACDFFSAELLALSDSVVSRLNDGMSFQLLLVTEGCIEVTAGDESAVLKRGQSALIPGGQPEYAVGGRGAVLVYSVT